jgi:hypothetical protein
MLPSAFVVLDRLPLTATGKIDRNRCLCREAKTSLSAEIRPLQTWNKNQKIWSKVLGVPTLHREDDFFVLGGHSLLATRSFPSCGNRSESSFRLQRYSRNRTVAP